MIFISMYLFIISYCKNGCSNYFNIQRELGQLGTNYKLMSVFRELGNTNPHHTILLCVSRLSNRSRVSKKKKKKNNQLLIIN